MNRFTDMQSEEEKKKRETSNAFLIAAAVRGALIGLPIGLLALAAMGSAGMNPNIPETLFLTAGYGGFVSFMIRLFKDAAGR